MDLWSVARVSTTGQDTEGQIPANEVWARANGHEITKTLPIKASAFKPGKALDRHIDEIIKAKPEGIVMRRADRLSRLGIERGLATVRRLREAGIRLYLADLGDASEVNEMTLAALFYVAYEESRVKSARALDNHAVMASRGAWMGVAPFGYSVVGSGGLNARLTACDEEATILIEMFERCARGETLRGLEVWCASLGYLRPALRGEKTVIPFAPGMRPWKPTGAQIRKILDRESYATGETTLTSTPRDRDGNAVESKRITWTHKHPAIVTRELSDSAQASKNERRTREDYSRDNTIQELEGALTCSKCGYRIYLRNKKINGRYYERYECRNGHGGPRAKVLRHVSSIMHGYIAVKSVDTTTLHADPRTDELDALRKELARCNPATNEGFDRIVELRQRIAELSSMPQPEAPEPVNLIWVDVSMYETSTWAERRELVRKAGIKIPA